MIICCSFPIISYDFLVSLVFWLLTKSQRVFKFSQTVEVHGDYTPTSAAEIFEWQLSKVEPTKAAAYREGHFLLINAWRNLNPQPVEHDTLAVCGLDGKMCFFFWGGAKDSEDLFLTYLQNATF